MPDNHSPAHQESSQSLFAAGVVAVKVFAKAGWRRSCRTRIRLEIELREPSVKHTLAQLQRWANGATRSPVEKIKRERMRELLEAKFTGHEERG